MLHLPVLHQIKSVAQKVEYLPSVPEAMGSILSNYKEQKRLYMVLRASLTQNAYSINVRFYHYIRVIKLCAKGVDKI